MTPTRLACLALALPFVLAGCGGSTPPSSQPEKKPDGGGAASTAPVNPAATPPPVSGPADDATTKAASDFLHTVGAGTAAAAALSPPFLKVIGKPVAFETDIAKGYSTDAADVWLRTVGGGLTFGLPSGTAGGGAAVLSGSFQGQTRSGRYLIRLVQEGGWKVDWFQLSSARPAASATPTGPDAAYQDFAAAAFLDLLADKDGMAKASRIPLLANLLSPELRKAWATPFGSDTAGGYDYSPAQIDVKLAEIGAVEAYTAGVAADMTVKGDLTKAEGKKPFTLKLTKGTAPGQWLVAAFAQ